MSGASRGPDLPHFLLSTATAPGRVIDQPFGGRREGRTVLARRKGLVAPVQTSVGALPAGTFRPKQGIAPSPGEHRQLQAVKTAFEQRDRFQIKPVKHAES